MLIGIPREIKRHEYRVAMTPAGAAELIGGGHEVLVEEDAGMGSGFGDDEYRSAGATVCTREEVFARSELIVKVKEPLPPEFGLLRDGQALFTYLHLAPEPELTDLLLARRVTAIGYETVERNGILPLLAPMSEIAGRMAPLAGSWCLQRFQGGMGLLPCGTPGVKPGRTLIIGAGVVGSAACRIAVGLGMETTVLNRGLERLQRLDDLYGGRVKTSILTGRSLEEELRLADLVIGALLVPGGRTPVLITRELLGVMKPGSVLVDVSVDQGGCATTTRPTTHDAPTYVVDGVVHYCVANMPGAYPRTSTIALTNATLPYIRTLATRGIDGALQTDRELSGALNTRDGVVTHPALATATGRECHPFPAA